MWVTVSVNFSRDVPEEELLGACFNNVVQLIFYEVVEVPLSRVDPNLRRWWRLQVIVEALVWHST